MSPVTYPHGSPAVADGVLTVDMLTRPLTRVEAIFRDLMAANQGYFAESLFRMPGMTVQGGAVLYQETTAGDHFLDPDQSIAPRAPGAESPLVGLPRDEWKVAKVQSLAAKFEVTDEERRRNLVDGVVRAQRRIANTFTDAIQSQAVALAESFLTDNGRTVTGIDWGQAYTDGIPNADPSTLPQRDFAAVLSAFIDDRTGVRPGELILNTADAFLLDVIYGDRLQPLLDRYNLTLRVSPEKQQGSAMFVETGGVGFIAYEKPLSVEPGRGPVGTWKDIYAVEVTPVIVANDATAGMILTGINPTP